VILFLYTLLVAASTAVLIFAGGMVTSTGSGLSVPDWPNTYGWFMWTFPLEKMVGGIFYEHTHRLIASTVGFLIVVLALWLWRAEPRRWVRRLGYIALGAVITQGVLGGITVLWYLPDPISIAHASLAEIVFCLTVTIALVESPGWKRAYVRGTHGPVDDPLFRRLAAATTAIIYLQILIGATMRHTNAGLAIPDFPFAFGHLIPPHWDAKIAIHFAHRVGALVVTTFILATIGHAIYHHRAHRELLRPSLLLLTLLPIQITLGALTVLSGKQPVINSFHVVTGASVLITSLVLTLRAHRVRFADAIAGSPSPTLARGAAASISSSNPGRVARSVNDTPAVKAASNGARA
jgi:cytochrome c oxidase assembly protein subunit 15